MELVCECGYEARDADQLVVVRLVRRHAQSAHNMNLSAEQVMDLARSEGHRLLLDQRVEGETDGPT